MLLVPAVHADELQNATGISAGEYFASLGKMKPMEIMHMMDEGNKGYVTKEEFMKFHEAVFAKMDKDHDGRLSTAEWLGRELRKTDG
jgi:Ca2+-binding EF-hand superfamily protein